MHKARGFAWETDNNGHLQIPIPTSGNPSGPGYRVTHTCIKPSQKSSNVLSQSYVCEERTLYYLIPFEWMSLPFFFFFYLLQHCFAFITDFHILTPHRNQSMFIVTIDGVGLYFSFVWFLRLNLSSFPI